MPRPPLRGDLEKGTEPLLQLGSTLGQVWWSARDGLLRGPARGSVMDGADGRS